jgi:hypothetical protein
MVWAMSSQGKERNQNRLLEHAAHRNKLSLQVQNVPQLKYVTEDDLHSIGMSKPEMRRLKKYFQKHFPQNYLSKFKKVF